MHPLRLPLRAYRRRFRRLADIVGLELPVGFELVHAALFKLWATAKSGTAMPVIFCAALCKGASRSDGTQAFTTAFHTMIVKLNIRIWFEWVPSEASPADESSRQGSSPFVASLEVHPLRLPLWADRRRSRRLADIVGLAQAVTPGLARPLCL